jgi:NodT family efflux transporter outer membrane factor (OMF) lipoprotein
MVMKNNHGMVKPGPAKGTSGIKYLALLLLGLALCGCTVGPDYKHPPPAEFESGFSELGKTTSADPAAQPSHPTARAPSLEDWWRLFRDPELDRLIQEALRQNYELQIATARIRQARFQRGIVAADLFPEVNASAGYNHALGSENVVLPIGGGGPTSAPAAQGGPAVSPPAAGGKTRSESGITPGRAKASTDPSGATSVTGSAAATPRSSPAPNEPLSPFGQGGLPGLTTDLYQIGFDASWEIDVFGGNRRRVEAAIAELAAAIESGHNVLVTLLAEVAQDYLQLRGSQERLSVLQQNLAAQKQVLELTRSMRRSGLVSELDVTRAAAEAATTAAQIPPLEAAIRRMIHALSILLDQQPNSLSDRLAVARPLPPVPPDVPIGLPSELLRRRPDVRQAERQIAAATAHVGSAKADLFPRFLITGTAGLDASQFSKLFNWQSHYFLISPTVVWPIFEGGRIVSNIALQKANQEEAVLQYRRTILVALQEVEDSLVAYSTEQARKTSLTEALQESRASLDIARNQYEHGLADFLHVLDAERNLLSAEDALAQSNQSESTDLVALYKALGGGWENQPLPKEATKKR